MSDNNDDKIKKYAIIGGLTLATCFIVRHVYKEDEQNMIEERNRQAEWRRLKSLRRQEFLHNIIYKIFKVKF